jgi:hypothetical protein
VLPAVSQPCLTTYKSPTYGSAKKNLPNHKRSLYGGDFHRVSYFVCYSNLGIFGHFWAIVLPEIDRMCYQLNKNLYENGKLQTVQLPQSSSSEQNHAT